MSKLPGYQTTKKCYKNHLKQPLRSTCSYPLSKSTVLHICYGFKCKKLWMSSNSVITRRSSFTFLTFLIPYTPTCACSYQGLRNIFRFFCKFIARAK